MSIQSDHNEWQDDDLRVTTDNWPVCCVRYYDHRNAATRCYDVLNSSNHIRRTNGQDNRTCLRHNKQTNTTNGLLQYVLDVLGWPCALCQGQSIQGQESWP